MVGHCQGGPCGCRVSCWERYFAHLLVLAKWSPLTGRLALKVSDPKDELQEKRNQKLHQHFHFNMAKNSHPFNHLCLHHRAPGPPKGTHSSPGSLGHGWRWRPTTPPWPAPAGAAERIFVWAQTRLAKPLLEKRFAGKKASWPSGKKGGTRSHFDKCLFGSFRSCFFNAALVGRCLQRGNIASTASIIWSATAQGSAANVCCQVQLGLMHEGKTDDGRQIVGAL